MIRRLIKLVVFLGVIGGLGLVGFAYFGDLSPPRTENSVMVTLDAD